MNQVIMLVFTITALMLCIIALAKDQTQHPMYLKIEVRYGK
ncbi:hypothetical protein [Nostoc sp. UHCC 0251]|nr:hypothetical protein [Nostoc sp. UHCC 0251]MEA5622515.1 hypothetical protein [Nostoc sp. UHCC 0251]